MDPHLATPGQPLRSDNGAASGRPKADDRVRDARLFERIYVSGLAHRMLPISAALALCGLRAKTRAKRNPAELGATEHFLRELLRNTPRAGEAEALAPRLMAEKSRNQEMLYHPWLVRAGKARVEGIEHWHEAGEGGRGFIVTFGHLGASWCIAPVLRLADLETYIVIGPHYWDLPPGYKGLEFRHRRRHLEVRIGADHVISSAEPPERLVEVVAGGKALLVAWDAPGRAATPFLGRTIGVGGGPARLAHGLQVKVLPVVPERHGGSLVVRIYPPIDSRDYPDHRTMRTAIAQAFEPIVVENPEAYELVWQPPPLITPPPAREPEPASEQA